MFLWMKMKSRFGVHKVKVPMFTKRTINSYHYIRLILTKLLTELPEKRMHSYFMHKNVTDHSTNFSATVMKRLFGKYITDTLWPRSPHLNLWLWGTPKKTRLCMYILCKNWKKIFNQKLLTFQGKGSHMKWNTINPSTVPPSLSPQVCLKRNFLFTIILILNPLIW